ncbi:MAG TPA: Mut7-C RNAse domain-containing protein [Myxococcota bacterium]
MSVPCARCGREYDVTLFEFGRTLWCTCGSRVGVEPRIRQVSSETERRFIADAMLGKLAHWLRLLGFDCLYESDIADAELVRLGMEQGRVVLTRDRALPDEWRAPDICVLRAERTFEQLNEVVRRFDLARAVRLFSRCSECNRDLAAAAAADLTGRAPASILATHERLRECPGCRRVYWEGSHTRRIQRVVERLLAPL